MVAVHDLSSIYWVPLLLESQGVLKFLIKRFELPFQIPSKSYLRTWRNLADRLVKQLYWVVGHNLLGLFQDAPSEGD